MYLDRLFKLMAEKQASDLFISCGAPINIKINGVVSPISTQPMDVEAVRRIAYELMTKDQAREFENEMEMNLSYLDRAVGNFRINIFRQRGTISLVIRYVRSSVPPFEELKLPPVLLNLVMEKRGLILIAGATGSGKSTTLAAMIDHRNRTSAGHIITVEDPVEYVHPSQKSLVTHREVGVDTHSWHHALKNTLRQAPDVILIGEIRDAETMEHAIAFAETGHLCLGTLHANSASQTIERIINFFPDERKKQLLMDLSANLRGIVSQRLVRREDGAGRSAAIEILLNTPTIAEKIFLGDFHEIKGIMARSRELGMCTFDAALFDLYDEGLISFEEALRNADSTNELRLNIKLKSRRGEPKATDFGGLSLNPMTQPADLEEREHQEMLKKQESRKRFEEEQIKALREKKRLAELAAAARGD